MGSQPIHEPQTIQRDFQMPMQPGSVALSATKAARFIGSDGRLELLIPAGAVTAQDIVAAGGTITLKVTQIAPASGSNAGSDLSLGAYLLQLVDAKGNLLSHGLHKAITARFHLHTNERGLGLSHAYVVFNGVLSAGTTKLKGVVQPAANKALASTMGTLQHQNSTLDSKALTLTVTPLIGTPSTSLSWNSDAPISTFGKPDPFSTDLSSGGLTDSEPVSVPAGPGGLTPPVNLSYSSESVNEQHSYSSAAGWVGEGWNLSMGEITWNQHNVVAGCTPQPSCGTNWQNQWSLNDPYGTSSELIPPNFETSTYYDASSNIYCALANPTQTCPILWHTANESHAKIYAYLGPITIPSETINPVCWRVWLPNGIMEEFGCSSDSLQYFYVPGGHAEVSGWFLDLITDPQGNQIHITYQRDMASWKDPSTGTTYSYPRDIEMQSIQYDSPGCLNAQTMCTGSSWAPQMQVVFNASHAPTTLTGTAPTGCNTGSNLRCDDPTDLSSSGGTAAPLVQGTYVLNNVQVQVRSSGTGIWNTLSTYKLGYEQSGPTQITDPASGMKASVAGMLDLTQFQQVGSDGSTSLPKVTFSYTSETNYYEDTWFKPNPSTNCGPSWNTGNGSGCLLWEQSYANNSRFLSSVSNGQGLAQSFSWMLARDNTHGVPGGGSNNADPFYCDAHQTTSPCQEVDDSGWSHAVLSSESDTTVRLTQNGQGGTQTSTPITETTSYSYQLAYPLLAQECSDCVAGMYWGDQNNNNYLNYYDGIFMGFVQTTVNEPTGGVEVHKFYAGEGWGIYDPNEVHCYTPNPCHTDRWWDLANAAHGREYQTLTYDRDGTTLLSEVDSTYTATCPPTGVSPTPPVGSITWDGQLISDLDHNNPVVVCDIHQTQQVSKTYDGASTPVTTTANYTYDSYGRVTQETTTSNGGTPTEVIKNTGYVWNDSVTATKTSATGTYIINTVAIAYTVDGSGNCLQYRAISYDGQSYASGQSSTLTGGLATKQDNYASCGTTANGYAKSGASTTTTKYDAYGDAIATDDPDANGGISGHTGCTVSGTAYTSCTAYDSIFDVFPTSSSNALNQTSSTSYSNTGALFGYGTWPQSTTDLNGQTTNYTYDALGRMTSETLPGETSGDQTKQWVYTNWCSGTAAQSPCEEIDEIDRLDSNSTVTIRAFYDGEGRLIETRAPGPVGQDVVTFAEYDTAGRQIFKSNPYFVTAYTGTPGAAAYSIPDSTQPGTTTNYAPNAGITTLRTTSVTDPNSHVTTTTNNVICGVSGTSDTGCYKESMVVDANGHESSTLIGGLGKTNYTQTYTGTSGSYALYATTTYTYDAAGNLLSTKSPDSSLTTTTYNGLGHATSQSDPDRGTTTFVYDPNGNVTETVDARGSAGTTYTGYDGLDRPLWRNSTNSPTGAWASYAYDSTANGNLGIGHLTGESFTSSGSLSGSYSMTYDERGQETAEIITINSTNYQVQTTYNDSGMLLSETYPTGEVVTDGFDANGWLMGVNTQSGSTVTTIASNVIYSGLAGAAGRVTTMDLGSGDIYNASYDPGMRLTSASLTQASNNTLLYQTQPTYDAANNVVSVQTSIGGATDTQQFCYDSLNRLTWSGTSGTPPCSGASFSAGTLTSAQYQQSDAYNIEGGLTSGPAGTYTYGDSSHPHAVTSASNGYSAAYDAAGNETCRSLTSATTCSGTQTGQQLSYDAEGRLSAWDSQPASPAQTANYLYDGSGNRVAMLTSVNGTSTLTVYIGNIEEVQTTDGTTTTTTYYGVQNRRIAAKVNGTFYYFGYDALGSQVAILNNSGILVGSQLYSPYGSSRYSNGTLPTSIGFTGQQTDSVTGLDYYNARYYDPTVGQFLSADTKQGNAQGINPYAYVGGNPETRTDPTGHKYVPGGMGGDGGDGLSASSSWLEAAGELEALLMQAKAFHQSAPSDSDIAYHLGLSVEGDRHDKGWYPPPGKTGGRRKGTNGAAGEWYITDKDGKLIDYGNMTTADGDIVAYSQGGRDKHAEKLLLQNMLNDYEVDGFFLKMLEAGGGELHFVIFTQLSPCDSGSNSCQAYFPQFLSQMKQKLENLSNEEDTFSAKLGAADDDENQFSVSLSVWATSYQDVYYSGGKADANTYADNLNVDAVELFGVTNYFNETTTPFED